MGLAVLIGILSPQLALIGPDAAVHMSEEVRNASKTIPKIMFATLFTNGALGFTMLVTLCFCVGNLEEVLQTPTGYPFIQVRPTQLRSSNYNLIKVDILQRNAPRCNNHGIHSRHPLPVLRRHEHGHRLPPAFLLRPRPRGPLPQLLREGKSSSPLSSIAT